MLQYYTHIVPLCMCRIQTERQERKRVKQEMGIEEPGGRKTRFDPPEPVASGISLGIKPMPAGTPCLFHCLIQVNVVEIAVSLCWSLLHNN